MSKCSDYLFKVQSEMRGLTCRTCIRLIQELSFQKKNSWFMFPPSYNLVDICNCKRLCWLFDFGSYWAENQDFTLNFVWFDHTFLKYIHTDLVLVAHLATIPADGFNTDTIMQQTWQQTNIINQWQSLYFVGLLVLMRILDGFVKNIKVRMLKDEDLIQMARF